MEKGKGKGKAKEITINLKCILHIAVKIYLLSIGKLKIDPAAAHQVVYLHFCSVDFLSV